MKTDSFSENMRALLEDAVRNSKEKISPNVLVALAAVVDKKHTGKGLSFEIVNTMKGLAAKRGLSLLIVPVRPTLKHQYPLIPLPEYADGKRDDGLPFEPWLRVHKKQGGEKFKISNKFMKITGAVQEWEEWSGVEILGKGKYIIPGALNPVDIDYENNLGIYYDPCVWIKYKIDK